MSTTVVEVGVDVPEASIMMIWHAERFGLSQLHQLRGRVGRGARRCFLLHDPNCGQTARRLRVLENSTDGFEPGDGGSQATRARGDGGGAPKPEPTATTPTSSVTPRWSSPRASTPRR